MRGYNVGLLNGDVEIDGAYQAGFKADEKRGRPQLYRANQGSPTRKSRRKRNCSPKPRGTKNVSDKRTKQTAKNPTPGLPGAARSTRGC